MQIYEIECGGILMEIYTVSGKKESGVFQA